MSQVCFSSPRKLFSSTLDQSRSRFDKSRGLLSNKSLREVHVNTNTLLHYNANDAIFADKVVNYMYDL